VATLSVGLAERVDAIREGPLAKFSFSRDELRQIEFAGVLHDFGKVGVRENVLVKAKKLYPPQLLSIRQRLDYVRKCVEVEFLSERLRLIERGIARPETLQQLTLKQGQEEGRVERLWMLVLAANEPTIIDGERLDELAELAALKFDDVHGRKQTYLAEDELAALQVARGSLTESERREIQSHVNHTISFLKTIPWGRSFARIPHIAGAHHESLDGCGYPYGLKGDEIPIEARMLTIADIFDALTASDRPYKAAVPVARALAILEEEVRRGRCDRLLWEVFIETKIYERVL
jgi:response regulator RpfG family c-di-GMP phosphodiesterase